MNFRPALFKSAAYAIPPLGHCAHGGTRTHTVLCLRELSPANWTT